MTRGESIASAAVVFLIALTIRFYAASLVVFPKPEDTAYYVDVARNLLSGRGLVTDALWSFQTPPLVVPREAFEVWLPLPTFLAAIPMALFGSTFAAAQVSSVVIGALVPVLAWRLAADVALEQGLPPGRARTLAIGTGLTAAVSLPLLLHSTLPDSTMLFGALTLATTLLITRIRARAVDSRPTSTSDVLGAGILGSEMELVGDSRPTGTSDGYPAASTPQPARVVARARPMRIRAGATERQRPLALLVALGAVLGLAAITRNEALWLALVWAALAWRMPLPARDRLALILVPAVVALAFFVPWMIRDWIAFGSPLPGQALTNALSIQGTDIFAWSDRVSVGRYLAVGPARLLEMRIVGIGHNLFDVLAVPGAPLSIIGLIALPWVVRVRALQPLLIASTVIFLVTSLLFPVSTTWGTFLHAAGAIHVVLIVSALLALDQLIAAIRVRRRWTRPVAWLAPTLTVSGALLFSLALLPAFGIGSVGTARMFTVLDRQMTAAGLPIADIGPVISDAPIWLPYVGGGQGLALPFEAPSSVLDLARRFSAHTVVQVDPGHPFAGSIATDGPDAACFEPVTLGTPADPADAAAIAGTRVFRIVCP
ncbi:MAG TPA: hypothetical protein VM427_03075 [Patescibacteria group bacterium]|nr:hypothetical protein [Patescibacteria group bacterium]